MRSIVLTAACALALGVAAFGGASAAPLAGALDGVNVSPIENAQVVIVTPGRRHYREPRVHFRGPVCRTFTRCHINRFGRRICATERVCR